MSATTSLGSKVVSQHSALLAPLAVDAVLKVIDPLQDHDVDLRVSVNNNYYQQH
jgi:T-complex protein 1 subunit delta